MGETIFARELLDSLVWRTTAAAVLSCAVAGVAWRKQRLSGSGAAAAVVCGTLSSAGDWRFGVILLGYFLAATIASTLARPECMQDVAGMVAKGDRRDAVQVVANGGIYCILAVLGGIAGEPVFVAGALGALAASSSDSWATAFGTRFGGRPRLITTGAQVLRGQSGGVTLAGVVGAIAGSGTVAGLAVMLTFPRGLALASVVAGVIGSSADSLLGATLQERRWCDRCDQPTERHFHVCGNATRWTGGIQTVDNDVINLLSTLAGSVSGVTLYWLIGWFAGRGFIG